jgi:uncharacterized membrane protein YfcA
MTGAQRGVFQHPMPIYLPVATMSIDLFLLLGMGLGVGVLSGLFGIGGGFILTPLLIFLGVPPPIAVGTGAAQVVASSISGAIGHWKRRNVDIRLGLLLIAGGLIGSTTGILLQKLLKAVGQLELFIAVAYVVILGVIGSLMLIESARTILTVRIEGEKAITRRGGAHSWMQKLPIKMRFRVAKIYGSAIPPVAIGLLTGWLTAIMGVGGGFLLVPALTTVMQATVNHTVDIMLAAPLMAGGVVGAQIGVRAGEKLKAEQLRFLLALLVVAVAARIAFGLTVTPRDIYVLDIQP